MLKRDKNVIVIVQHHCAFFLRHHLVPISIDLLWTDGIGLNVCVCEKSLFLCLAKATSLKQRR